MRAGMTAGMCIPQDACGLLKRHRKALQQFVQIFTCEARASDINVEVGTLPCARATAGQPT